MFRDSFKISFGITLGIGLAKMILNLPSAVSVKVMDKVESDDEIESDDEEPHKGRYPWGSSENWRGDKARNKEG